MIDFVICVDSKNLDKIELLVHSIRKHHNGARVNLIVESGTKCEFVDRMYIVPYSYLYQDHDPYPRINMCTFFRFWIHYAWPDIKRCIYLDWDTLVVGDMSDELDGDYIIKAIETIPGNYNAGVIYFNFDNSTTIELLDKCRTSPMFIDDQHMINKIFRNHITPISKKYNYMQKHGEPLHDDIRCIHYIGGLKPWNILPVHYIYFNACNDYNDYKNNKQ
jgi:lipopolysaccharide biosynthesis glycosyltransferase